MGSLIDFTKYKEEAERKQKQKERCVELHNNLDRKRERIQRLVEAYDEEPQERILTRMYTLKKRHNYDIYFINLMDQFMEECYPEYRYRFSDWLDKNDY